MTKDLKYRFELAAAVENRLDQIREGIKPLTIKVDDPVKQEFVALAPADVYHRYQQVALLAALSGRFEPWQLIGGDVDEQMKSDLLKLMSTDYLSERENGRLVWIMKQLPRTAILTQLITSGELTQLRFDELPATDRYGQLLRAVLSATKIDISAMSQDDLLTFVVVLESIADVPIEKPLLQNVKKHIIEKSFLEDYDVLLRNGFVGRQKELAMLNSFVRESKPHLKKLTAMKMSGIGGAGKSTLLAKFIKDIYSENMATIVVMDFDRPGIDPSDSYWREMELSRQIGHQYPALRQRLHNLRAQIRATWEEDAHYFYQGTDALSALRSVGSNLLTEISHLLQSMEKAPRPLLMIFDTFEEVVDQGLTDRIADWIYAVAEYMGRISVKVIFSGRALDTRTEAFRVFNFLDVEMDVSIGEFDDPMTRQFLQMNGVPESYIPKIIAARLLPHRPLELKLLAQVLANGTTTIGQLEKEFAKAGNSSKQLFTGLVYKRVLNRIKDPKIRKLAYPGLILRYITPGLIEEVLMPAMKGRSMTQEEALGVLNGLASYGWLAYRGADNEVYHRKDLRRVMLKLMISQEPGKARQISQKAIRYFEQGDKPSDKWEAIYHRLLLLRKPADVKKLLLDDLKKTAMHIGADSIDLPEPAQILLRYASTGKITPNNISYLPDTQLVKAYDKTGQRLVEAYNFAKAFELYKRSRAANFRKLRPMAEPQSSWEIETLIATGNWQLLEEYYVQRQPFRKRPTGLKEISTVLYSLLFFRLHPKLINNGMDYLLHYLGEWSSDRLMRAVLKSEDIQSLTRITAFIVHYPSYFRKSKLAKSFVSILLFLFQQGVNKIPWQLSYNCLMLHRMNLMPQLPAIFIYPSQVKLNSSWIVALMDEKEIVRRSNAGKYFKSIYVAVAQRERSMPKRSARRLLADIDAVRKTAKTETLYWEHPYPITPYFNDLLRGCDPEFRNPVRYAILEAFSTKTAYKSLGALFAGLIPFPLQDLQQEHFIENMTTNPEETLLHHIELIDRCRATKKLLEQLTRLKPANEKFKMIYAVYQRWEHNYHTKL